MTNKPMTILSLGAGVQSSTLALMAAHGEITPMPDHAIFADTGAEPKKVYEWLDWLEKQLPYPVHRVSNGNLLTDILKSAALGERVASPPLFIAGRSNGIARRQCTAEYKITPLVRKQRELAGLKKGERCKELRVITWQGISLDEIQRAKMSTDAWCEWRYPLIEKRLTRGHCLEWMERHGYPTPPRSACTFCPYHSNDEWKNIKAVPDEWAQAIAVDEAIRDGIYGFRDAVKLYLHRSLKPLAEIDFRNAKDMGQMDAFEDECEGMCGM